MGQDQTQTPIRDSKVDAPTPEPSPGASTVSGGRNGFGYGVVAVDASGMRAVLSEDARGAILQSLYAERAVLIRAQGLGTATAADNEKVDELEACIDELEAPDRAASDAAQAELWAQVNELAKSVIAVQAKVEQHRK